MIVIINVKLLIQNAIIINMMIECIYIYIYIFQYLFR